MNGDDAIARLEAAARKAREFEHSIGERTYTLRVPVPRELFEVAHRRGAATRASLLTSALTRRYALEEAIVAWTGVRERDLVDGGASDPVPWSARAVVLLLDRRTADAAALEAELFRRHDERVAAIEADKGN